MQLQEITYVKRFVVDSAWRMAYSIGSSKTEAASRTKRAIAISLHTLHREKGYSREAGKTERLLYGQVHTQSHTHKHTRAQENIHAPARNKIFTHPRADTRARNIKNLRERALLPDSYSIARDEGRHYFLQRTARN